MRSSGSSTVLLLAGSLALAAGSASGATATGRASARIVDPARIAVAHADGWAASVRATGTGRVVDTTLRFRIDRPRDYSFGVRLERGEQPVGTSRLTLTERHTEERGFSSARRLQVELPDTEDAAGHGDRSHVRIVVHNY